METALCVSLRLNNRLWSHDLGKRMSRTEAEHVSCRRWDACVGNLHGGVVFDLKGRSVKWRSTTDAGKLVSQGNWGIRPQRFLVSCPFKLKMNRLSRNTGSGRLLLSRRVCMDSSNGFHTVFFVCLFFPLSPFLFCFSLIFVCLFVLLGLGWGGFFASTNKC